MRGFSKSPKSLFSNPSRRSAGIRSWPCTFLGMIFRLPCHLPSVEATQGALIQLERWFEYRHLPRNPSKCETFFFSTYPHQANLQPHLRLFNSQLRFNYTQIFCGVTCDRILSFSKNVSSLKAKFFPRLKSLSCISDYSWGPSFCIKFFLRHLLTYVYSDRAASRAITGCYLSKVQLTLSYLTIW